MGKESTSRSYFDRGFQRLIAYHHQEALKCFLSYTRTNPDCALAFALSAICHSPNYNFRGTFYYEVTSDEEFDVSHADCFDVKRMFPCQQHAHYYASKAYALVKRLSEGNQNEGNPKSVRIDKKDVRIIEAVMILCQSPGLDPSMAEEKLSLPYVDAMRNTYKEYPDDPDVAYFFAESLMVLHAWRLYDYPTKKVLSPDVEEARDVLESTMKKNPTHPGLCHLYIHLCEMSPDPGKALNACSSLRTEFTNFGHLIHMGTHIDVLLGDYEACVKYNLDAISVDLEDMKEFPDTAGAQSFYFGYIVHNFHMLVFGAMLGGMEKIALDTAKKLNSYLFEEFFVKHKELAVYLESYSALDVHVLVRFGRWDEILKLSLPEDSDLMLYRSGSLRYARALALAARGDVDAAETEAEEFERLSTHDDASERLLHNNNVSDLFAVDVPMIRGEIAYRSGKYDEAFALLRESVRLQDSLNYDEPWGKMQPVRHALGGLLLEQHCVEEAEAVYRADLKRHPQNPWSLHGLLQCLERANRASSRDERERLQSEFWEQRKKKWADFEITKSCECCCPGV